MQLSCRIPVVASVLIGLTINLTSSSIARAGETCKDSAGKSPCEGTNSPCVCVERADLNDPEELAVCRT